MEWSKESIHELVLSQRRFFKSNVTLDVNFRIAQLKRLKMAMIKHHESLEKALYDDLGRCGAEAYLLDIGTVIMEINECIHNLKKWAKPERHYAGLHLFPATKALVYKMPYGVSLIVSPFNFPILLSIGVVAASISGGNTCIVKASSKTPNVTLALQKMIEDTFPKEYITIVDGGHDVADWCLEEDTDKIFYTGSPNVAKHVMECAAKNLTPIALELGGETGNWAIVRKDANIKDCARKIAFFKIVNSGQVCININQVAVAKEIADEFVEELKKAIIAQIGENPSENEEYPRLIAKRAFLQCEEEADLYKDRIVFGGQRNIDTLKFSTTLIYPVKHDEPICNHELFSPLLPIVPFDDDNVNELLDVIASREHGLALYIFTKDIKWAKKVMSTQQYGGGCINEVCVQMMVEGVPFNGTGHSGMGAYHGEWGFKEFSHPSTVLIGKTRCNLSLREHPYNKKFFKIDKKKIFRAFFER